MAESESEEAIDASIIDKIFGRSKRTETVVDESDIVKIDKNADLYNMNHYKRGYAIILNHYQFDNQLLASRDGTEKDVNALEDTLKFLQFDVITCNNYTYSEICDKLNEYNNHADSDCLLVAVLTHGYKGRIYAKDKEYAPENLWEPFTGDRCPTLAGKPKIFFIQASRGTTVDSMTSRSIFTSRDSTSSIYTIPTMADILVMYSSSDGYLSWQNPITGSLFIQCLCEELKLTAREKDLLAILHRVNQKIVLEFENNIPSTEKINFKNQVGSIVSTFTRLLFFYPYEESEDSN